MQDENTTFSDFAERTDRLASMLGVNLQELPEILGIARATLFSSRSGARPISGKTWEKLRRAELRNYEKVADKRLSLPALCEEQTAYRVSQTQQSMAEKIIEIRGQVRDLNTKLDELTTLFLNEANKNHEQ